MSSPTRQQVPIVLATIHRTLRVAAQFGSGNSPPKEKPQSPSA